ncbi:MAG: hypothetical protein OQK51_13130 [Kangiellaceae bacterium]|nr:hypothetical protein [Kangiellaceae bacterium]
MTIKELIEIIEKLETRNNSYWNFYTVVIVAVCGWVLAQKGQALSANIVLALMIGNGLFYFMNLSIIFGTTKRIVAFESELILKAKNDPSMGEELRSNLSKPYLELRLPFTVGTHLVMDIAVLAFIYLGFA